MEVEEAADNIHHAARELKQAGKITRARHATLAACRKSLDHRDVDRAADGAGPRDLSRRPLNPSAHPRYAIRVAVAYPRVMVAYRRAMRVRTSGRRGGARVVVRSARSTRSAQGPPA